ncbi:hypothetical protein B0919_19200 [Hymenobacter sp. CRA2]|nr:hypothetical protein B0919_19200 [Hymenobacter sp. CRA2]
MRQIALLFFALCSAGALRAQQGPPSQAPAQPTPAAAVADEAPVKAVPPAARQNKPERVDEAGGARGARMSARGRGLHGGAGARGARGGAGRPAGAGRGRGH